MAAPDATRSPLTRSLGYALALVAMLTVLLGGIEIALLIHTGDDPTWLFLLFPTAGLTYIACGVLAWWRRPSNGLGAVICAAGVALLIVGLGNTAITALMLPAVVLETVPLAFIVHLALAFPSGRLRTAAAWGTVAAGYGVALVLQVPLYLFQPEASPNGLLAIANQPTVLTWATWAQRVSGVAVMLLTAGILARRTHRARPTSQRVLLPLYIYATLVIPAIPILADVAKPARLITGAAVPAVQVALLVGVPVLFVLAVLRGGFVQMSEIHELGTWLGTADPARPTLTQALARALGDTSIQLAFWVPVSASYVDAHGTAAPLPASGSGRSAVEVDVSGRRIGAISYDSTLIANPELVRSAGRVVAIAMDRERLTAELLASQQALALSRERIVEAADRERRRIARNLHDGLQVQLVLLSVEAQRLAIGAGPDAGDAAVRLRVGIDVAAAGLRDIVSDVMPAALLERGLGAAIEDLTDRTPIPTYLDFAIPERKLPTVVESTAYFVVAEALTNAVKHSRATRLDVRLADKPDTLIIEVTDDGVGGAIPGNGIGLQSVFDRIDVVGGRVHLISPLGSGTQIVVEIPCGS